MKKRIITIIVLALSISAVIAISIVIALNPYVLRYYFNNETFNISEKQDSDEITIMSFNIRCKTSVDKYKESWYYRANLTIKNIKQEQPDIIGLQEAQTIHEKYYRKHLKGYAFQEGYREDTEGKEGPLILYRNDLFEAKESGLFWLSTTPDVQSKDWGSACYRVANYVTLSNKKDGKEFTIIDTHLDHISSEARTKGMEVIVNKIDELNLKNPILMGDMNDTEDSLMYETITNYGLNDSLKIAHTKYIGTGATYHNYGKALNYQRIDYIFTAPIIGVNDYHVADTTYDGVYPSDHFPIVVSISF